MNGAESISHGTCKFCGKDCLTEYDGKHYDYCPNCRTEKQRLETELEKHRWIPVSERFPNLNDRHPLRKQFDDGTVDVIAVDACGHVFGGNYFPKMKVWNFCTADPTHWKPIILPE